MEKTEERTDVCRGRENQVMFGNGFEVYIRDPSGLDICQIGSLER